MLWQVPQEPPLREPLTEDQQPPVPVRQPATPQQRMPPTRLSPVSAAGSAPPSVRLPAQPSSVSRTTAWWIAAGVIVVALAVAAGILVGRSLARRGGSGDPDGAIGPGRHVAPRTAGQGSASAMAEIFLAAHAPR